MPATADDTVVPLPVLLERLARVPEPRLTWYGPAGERVELSGRVLVNWVAKTANLLVDEADLGPGGVLVDRLGVDWRAPALWLATWYLGATPVRPQPGADRGPGGDDAPDPDVEVCLDGEATDPAAGTVLVVARGALARRATTLPAGAVDFAAEVTGMPDQLPAPGPAAAPPRSTAARGGRWLLGPDASAADLLSVLAGGGSVVWHAGLEPAALATVARQEHVDG